MAEITIRFRHNKTTGKKELVIHLESDSDVLSHEHEGDHRALVEQLIGQKLDADTAVVVERVEKDGSVVQEGQPAPVAQKQTEKA
jgi:hypothetical protein